MSFHTFSALLFKVHIQLAGDHAVVKLAALVRSLAVGAFKLHVRADDIVAVRVTLAEHFAHRAVDFLCCF